MKVLFWLAVTLVGAVISLGELAYVRYFVGETVGEAVLMRDGQPQPYQLDVGESDLPIRLNFKMFGGRKTIDIVHQSLVSLAIDGPEACETVRFQAVINENSDLSNASIVSGNLTLRPGEVPNMAQATELLDCATAGPWTLSASVSEERGFEMQTIQATIKRNSRAANWAVAGPGLVILLIGFIFLVVALRRRFPNLAT